MKRILITLAVLLFTIAGAFSQSNRLVKGDVNEDGQVDVADIVNVIDVMQKGQGVAVPGYFYLGTARPTADNYQTLPGVVMSYTSIDEASGTTAIIATGEILYMLCPAMWMEGKSVKYKDKAGNTSPFSDEIDSTAISGYVIYKTPAWNVANEVTLKTFAHRLKILCFGNSFTCDAMSYAPSILEEISPELDLTLGIAYIGGCSLAQHAANFTNTDKVLDGTTYTPVNYTLYKWDGNSKWDTFRNRTVDDLLSEDDWDIVTFQQNGGAAYKEWDSYFAPYIYDILKVLESKISNIKLGWLLTHGSYGSYKHDIHLEHWEGTAVNSKKILELTPIEYIFPYGTAIQNVRNTTLSELGDKGDLLQDGVHLQEGLPCLTAAYANAQTILDIVGINKTIIGSSLRPDAEWIASIKVPGPNMGDGLVGMTEENCRIAQYAAILSVIRPFEISDVINYMGN